MWFNKIILRTKKLLKFYNKTLYYCIMSKKKYKIITIGNKLLKKPSEKILNIDTQVNNLIETMFNIMDKYNGIGLAAVQIGVPKRIIIVDTTKVNADDFNIKKKVKFALINPEIVTTSEREEIAEEGCLSVPGIRAQVSRKFSIEVKGWTTDEKEVHIKLYDLNARVVQHEIDHLNGILFVEKVNPEYLTQIEKKLRRTKNK